jgi:hypothetical protein
MVAGVLIDLFSLYHISGQVKGQKRRNRTGILSLTHHASSGILTPILLSSKGQLPAMRQHTQGPFLSQQNMVAIGYSWSIRK